MPMTMVPIMTISVLKKFDAFSTICPKPAVAATISAATSVVQPKPIAIRIPVSISGNAAGSTTRRTTCQCVRRADGNLVHGVVHMRDTWLAQNRFQMGQPDEGRELANDLLRMIQLHGAENIAACFVGPIAGSTGVLVPPKGYLERLREICTQHGVLLVFDEVICGFGRTGQPFAAQSFGVTPGLITMAKAIANGAVPMAAVAIADHVHDTIVNQAPEGAIEFYHGYTWSAHPVACAAAIATLDIYNNEQLFEREQALFPYFLAQVQNLRDLPTVSDTRGYGMLAGVDIQSDGVPGHRGYVLQKRLFDAGLHIKTTGDCAI